MTLFYTAAFNVVDHEENVAALGELTVDRLSGSPQTIVAGIEGLAGTAVNGDADAHTFWVYTEENGANPGAEIVSCEDYSPYALTRFEHFSRNTFAGALTEALQAAAATASWTQVPRVTWSPTTGLYTVALYSDVGALVNSSWTWSTAGGRQLMGFSANQSGSNTYTGTLMPWYVVNPTLQDVSEPTPVYEPEAIGSRVVTDDGSGHGLARYVSPLYRDWRQEFETKEKTLRMSAAAAHPFTFQHFFEHVRGRYPFILTYSGVTNPEVFALREAGIPFVPTRATPGNDAQFHLPFQTIVEGTIQHEVIPQ